MFDDLKSSDVLRGSLAEFFATGLFVFVGAGTVVASGIASGGELDAARLVAISLGHGLAVAALVFAVSHISGGHLNPAVTFAAVLAGEVHPLKGAAFIAAQLTGAVLAGLLLLYVAPDGMQGNLGSHGLGAGVSVGMGFTVEFVLTFLLVFVVFAVAMDRRGPNAFAPLAIGLAVVIVHLAAVPLTGGSVNPARSLGPAVASGTWADHWIYWAAPLAAAALAALVYNAVFARRVNDAEAPA